jgi:hypothetical protein
MSSEIVREDVEDEPVSIRRSVCTEFSELKLDLV